MPGTRQHVGDLALEQGVSAPEKASLSRTGQTAQVPRARAAVWGPVVRASGRRVGCRLHCRRAAWCAASQPRLPDPFGDCWATHHTAAQRWHEWQAALSVGLCMKAWTRCSPARPTSTSWGASYRAWAAPTRPPGPPCARCRTLPSCASRPQRRRRWWRHCPTRPRLRWTCWRACCAGIQVWLALRS